MERSTIVIQQLILWLSLLVRVEIVVRCSGDIKAWLSSHMISGCLQLRWASLGQRSALSGLSLKSCQMFCLPLRRRSPSLPLSRAELLSYCCPILEVRWVGQLLALCLGLAAKSYNIAGRRKFCCRAIILLGEGNSVVLSYSRDAIYKYAYHILY